MNIKIITTTEEFEQLKDSWQHLFETAGIDSPFLSWEWMFTWWREYQPKLAAAKLSIFCAYQGEELIAVLPLFKHKRKNLSYIQFLGTEFESSDYLDLICTEDKKTDLVEQFFSNPSVIENLKSADILVFNNIKEGSGFFNAQKWLADTLRSKAYKRRTSVCPYFPLPPSVDKVFKSLSKNMRSSLKRQRNKLAKNETIQITLLQDETEIEEGIRHLFRLHSKRFSQKNMSTKFIYEKRGAFHEKMAKVFLPKGWLQFYLIKDNAKPIGALYCYRLAGTMMYMQGGFDPGYANLALGNQIILRAISDAIDGGMQIFDFMRGNEAYKKKWTDKSISLYTLDFPLSGKGRLALLFREKVTILKGWIKKAIYFGGKAER